MSVFNIQICLLTFGILLGFSVGDTSSSAITCPILYCETKNTKFDSDTCFALSGTGPINQIYGQRCYDESSLSQTDYQPSVCPFNLLDGSYGWLNETLQSQKATAKQGYDQDSQIRYKKVKEYCVPVAAFQQNLNPGRNCSSNYQCKSLLCDEGSCKGLEENSNCHSHADCSAGSYCRTAINWPYESRCSAQKGQYEACSNDYECQNSLYCWFASSSDRSKNSTKCIPMYSQDDGTLFGWYQISSSNTSKINFDDYQINGKYCSSGLAYPVNNITSRCTSANVFKQNNVELVDPYKCDASDQTKKCQIFFDIDSSDVTYTKVGTRGYVEVTCKCALWEKQQTLGFCGSVIGTEYYKKAVAALELVNESSNCHTLDRNDLRAQKDSCGIGTNNDEWRFAVDKMFNVTYWPYIQDSTVYKCVNHFFGDSWYNLNLNFGQNLLIFGSGLIVFAVVMII